MTTLYYFQQKMDFQRCNEIVQFCKWLVFYFFKQNDEFTIFIFGLSQQTYSHYKNEIDFAGLARQILESDIIGFPVALQELEKQREQA